MQVTLLLLSAVLFIADVKVQFDEFKKCMIATCDAKTIITVNPGVLTACSTPPAIYFTLSIYFIACYLRLQHLFDLCFASWLLGAIQRAPRRIYCIN